jgi:putative sigma-54 modulation protein
MDIQFQGTKNFVVTKNIKSYLLKRLEKINYFKNHIDKITFHFKAEKLIYKISATLSIKKFSLYKFEVKADEMYTAIDKIVHKMDVKINREKSKIQKHKNLGHEAVVDFFYEHEKNNPEPTKKVDFFNKPLTVSDAFLQMKNGNNHIFGFNLIDKNDSIAPAFLRELDDNLLYLFQQKNKDSYSELPLRIEKETIKHGKKVREIKLKKMNLLEAQKNILNQEYHYNIFINNNNEINFLLKENNGKWLLIS